MRIYQSGMRIYQTLASNQLLENAFSVLFEREHTYKGRRNGGEMNSTLPSLILLFSEIVRYQRDKISAESSGNLTRMKKTERFELNLNKIAERVLGKNTKTHKVNPHVKARLKQGLLSTAVELCESYTPLLMFDISGYYGQSRVFDVEGSELEEILKNDAAMLYPDSLFPLVERKRGKSGKLDDIQKPQIPTPLTIPPVVFAGALPGLYGKEHKQRRLGLYDVWTNYRAFLEFARQVQTSKQGKKDAATIERARQVIHYSVAQFCRYYQLPNLEEFKEIEHYRGHRGYQKEWERRVLTGPLERLGLFTVKVENERLTIRKLYNRK